MGLYRYEKPKVFTPRPRSSQKNSRRPADTSSYVVQGKDASDLEYFFAQALQRKGLGFIYSYIVQTAYQIPGQQNEVDFLVSGNRPFEIDGEFSHKDSSQKAKDRARDQLIDEQMRNQGWEPIIRIPNTDLEEDGTPTQAAAIEYVEENL